MNNIENNFYKLSEPYNYQNDIEYSDNEYYSFWDEVAKKYVKWDKMYDQVYSGNELKPDWFKSGKLNACYNALDVHALNDETKNNIAIIYECPVKGISIKITYKELLEQVCLFSRVLKNLGINKGDGVLIYMKSSIRAVIAMLSCARIGAVHCTVFAEFPSKALADRIDHFKPKLIVVSNYNVKGYDISNNLPLINKALELSNHKIENVIVYNCIDLIENSNDHQQQQNVYFKSNYHDWDELIKDIQPLLEYEILDSHDSISISYSSGTSGTPKGFEYFVGPQTVLVSYVSKSAFHLKMGDVFFSTCDIGWQVGQSIGIYSFFQMGVTIVLFEGDIITPNANCLFKIIEKHKVNAFMTTPSKAKLIREADPNGETISNLNLSSLKSIFTLGEKIDESIISYIENVTGGVKVWDYYGQSEMACGALTYPSLQEKRKGLSIGKSVPGFKFTVVLNDKIVKPFEIGEIVIKLPLPPGTITSLYKDPDNGYYKKYLKRNKGYFCTGDLGYFDEEGYFFLLSRVDDLVNIDTELIDPINVEDIILKNSMVSDCCVLGINDEKCGSRLVLLVIPTADYSIQFKNQQFLDQVHNDFNLEIKNKMNNMAKLKYLIPVSVIPRNNNGKKPKYVLSKILNNESYETPTTIPNLDDLKILSIEIDQYKSNIQNKCFDKTDNTI